MEIPRLPFGHYEYEQPRYIIGSSQSYNVSRRSLLNIELIAYSCSQTNKQTNKGTDSWRLHNLLGRGDHSDSLTTVNSYTLCVLII